MQRIVLRYGGATARGCLAAAVFLSPVVYLPATLDQFNLTKLLVISALSFLALGAWVVWSGERRRWLPPVRLLSLVGAFLAVCSMATAFSENPGLSLVGLYSRYGGLLPLLIYVVAMVVVVGVFWEAPESLRSLLWAAALATPPLAIYVILQAGGRDFVHWGFDAAATAQTVARHRQYPIGTMGNANFAGGYLGIALPAVAFAYLRARSFGLRTAVLSVAGLDLLALWLTRSRGGLLAAGAGLFVLAIVERDRVPRPVRFAAVAAMLAMAVAALVMVGRRTAEQAGSASTTGVLRTDTLVSRTWYWHTAWNIVEDHPVIGTGLDTYYAEYPQRRLPADGAQFGLTLADKPHNVFLEHAANSGLLGVGTYLLMLGAAFYWGLRRAAATAGGERLVLGTLLALLAAYSVQGVVSIDVPPLAFAGWIALGGVAACADPGVLEARGRDDAEQRQGERSTRRGTPVATRPPRRLLHAAVAVGVSVAAAATLVPLVADLHAKSAVFEARQTRDQAGALAEAERAIRFDPREGTYRAAAGDVAEHWAEAVQTPPEKTRLLRTALRRYEEAVRLRPGHVYFMIDVARLKTTLAGVDRAYFPVADRAWADVVGFDATDWEVHQMHAAMLNTWANATGDVALRRRTAEELEATVRIKPTATGAWVSLGKLYRLLGENDRARDDFKRALALNPGNREATEGLAGLP